MGGGGQDKRSPYVVQKVSNFENQLTKERQAMTVQKIWKTERTFKQKPLLDQNIS